MYQRNFSAALKSKLIGDPRYWDWPLWATDLAASPLFDGSETSLSGDGAFNGTVIPVNLGEYSLPGGSGGGCVTSGPFKNLTLSLGPFDFGLAFGTSIPSNAFEYNPRCFSRNLNNYVASTYNNQTDVDNVLAASDIIEFQTLLGGAPPTLANLGVHGAGHCTIGTTMQDFFASPADPAFMVFHGQIDRLWTLWQAEDPNTRRYAINGSSTIWYAPTTPEVTLDTVLEFNVLGPKKTMLELMSPTEYDFCYQY
jgi:tyrosinase